MNLRFICGHHVSLAFYSFHLHTYNLVLDPCITYEALKDEFAQDASLLDQLEDAKTSLRSHFNDKYMAKSRISSEPARLSSTPSSSLLSVTSQSSTTTTLAHANSSPQKNFTARFQRKRVATDELSEFWNLPQEDFENCNPVQWWYQRRAQFPNLYCLARDILSIPGMFFFIPLPVSDK
jgi:hAT family C-terminal dimerisation region